MKRLFLLGLLIAMAAPTSAAEQLAGRYSFVPVDGGVLRLDAETGDVAFCAVVAASATCTPAAPDTQAAEDVQADADSRLAAIEERLAAIESKPDPEVLADDEAIDRVTRLTERMMRSFFDLVREMKRDTEANEL
jgi:hypothetical protein